ncbi:MAG: DivIVA domain-containing protein [Lachnospiraceae bacterium]|nr:DivIVA domain-containing protein [Lachnospiraceae bacterium]
MLTPVDIQQKKFRTGLGYEKKDVNTFFDMVSESYEQLYRSNAELKEKVATLTDGLQSYKSKEAELEKTIMIAEKDSEDTKTKAAKEAKNIELDAKNKAKNIVADAEKQLEQIKQEIEVLETQYAAYKSNFVYFMKKQFDLLEEEDFDPKSYIDVKSLQLLGASGGGTASGSSSDFGSFSGDPQMRDESTLGGYNSGGGGSFNSDDMKNSTSAVYTSNLSAGENFVDPFNPDAKRPEGRYNPYDGMTDKSEKGSSFTVNKDGMSTGSTRRSNSGKTNQANKSNSSKSAASSDKAKAASDVKPDKKSADVKPEDKIKEDIKKTVAQEEKPKKPAVDNIFTFDTDKKAESAKTEEAKPNSEVPKADDIPTVDIDSSSNDDIEVEIVNDKNLLGDGEDDSGDGFEFV